MSAKENSHILIGGGALVDFSPRLNSSCRYTLVPADIFESKRLRRDSLVSLPLAGTTVDLDVPFSRTRIQVRVSRPNTTSSKVLFIAK